MVKMIREINQVRLRDRGGHAREGLIVTLEKDPCRIATIHNLET